MAEGGEPRMKWLRALPESARPSTRCAHLGRAPKQPAILRNVAVSLLTMGITYLVGRFSGVITG